MDAGVKQLLELKAQYKKLTGTDFPTPGGKTSGKKDGTTLAKKQPEVTVVIEMGLHILFFVIKRDYCMICVMCFHRFRRMKARLV